MCSHVTSAAKDREEIVSLVVVRSLGSGVSFLRLLLTDGRDGILKVEARIRSVAKRCLGSEGCEASKMFIAECGG